MEDKSDRSLLTAREREVAGLIARGWASQAIADQLGISYHTVRRHLSNIMDKLGAENRTQIAAWLLQNERGWGGGVSRREMNGYICGEFRGVVLLCDERMGIRE